MKELTGNVVYGFIMFMIGAFIVYYSTQYDKKRLLFNIGRHYDSLNSVIDASSRDMNNCIEMWQNQRQTIVKYEHVIDTLRLTIEVDNQILDALEKNDFHNANVLRRWRNDLLSDIYLFHLK